MGEHPLRQYVGDLGASDSPPGTALSAFWLAFPVLFGPFALAVYAGTRRGRLPWVTPTLLVVFSACIGLCGVFRCSPNCHAHTASTQAHLLVTACPPPLSTPVPPSCG